MTNTEGREQTPNPYLTYLLLVFDVLRMVLHCMWLTFVAIFRFLIPESPKSVRSRVVLITGAANGLGRQLALKFADLGARVVIWDVDQQANFKLVEEIRSRGGQVWSYEVDVSSEKQVEEAGQKVRLQVGEVQYLINNAGVLPGKPVMLLNSYQIRRTIEINTLSHFWTVRQFLPNMINVGEGHIVAVASIAGLMGCANLTDYCASKFGAVGFMSALREDLYNQGKDDIIHLTIACPPTMLTGLVHKPKTKFPSLFPVYKPEKVADFIVDGILRNKKLILPLQFYIAWKMASMFPIDAALAMQRYFEYSLEPNLH